ncbi:hypothetical protein ACN6LI_004595, partial [Streptomyces violaceoruber]
MTTPSAGFDSSWLAAQKVAEDAAALGRDVVLARDLLGRASLLIDDMSERLAPDSPELDSLRVRFVEVTRPFTG